MVVFMGIIFFLIINEINEMKRDTETSKLFIFSQENRVLSAFTVSNGEKPIILEDEELSSISSKLASNDLNSVLGSYHKLYIYKSYLIKSQDFNFEFSGRNLSYQEVLEIMNSTANKNLKAFIFANIINMYTQKGTDMVKSYKKEMIIVYPETITFKVLRFIPNSIIDHAQKFSKKEVNNGHLEQT